MKRAFNAYKTILNALIHTVEFLNREEKKMGQKKYLKRLRLRGWWRNTFWQSIS